MNHRILAGLIGFVLLTGCNNDPGKDKAKAQVAEPTSATESAVTKGTTTYKFSQADSKISFVGAKVTGKHEGSFGTFSGTVQGTDGDPTKSSVSVDIDMATIAVDEPKLTAHLKSPDFFDVTKFPKAHFTSTAIKAGGDKGATHTVTGNLELHGVTKAITFPATIRMTADGVDVDADFAINRKDFGVNYPGMPDNLIKDDVAIKLAVHAKKSAG